jgi:hypothetical protein
MSRMARGCRFTLDVTPEIKRREQRYCRDRTCLITVEPGLTFLRQARAIVCRPSGTRFHLRRAYPGLTPGAVVCRPSGAGVWCLRRPISAPPFIGAWASLRSLDPSAALGAGSRGGCLYMGRADSSALPDMSEGRLAALDLSTGWARACTIVAIGKCIGPSAREGRGPQDDEHHRRGLAGFGLSFSWKDADGSVRATRAYGAAVPLGFRFSSTALTQDLRPRLEFEERRRQWCRQTAGPSTSLAFAPLRSG